jgi:two-component system phosphate regulon response regulator OmpR
LTKNLRWVDTDSGPRGNNANRNERAISHMPTVLAVDATGIVTQWIRSLHAAGFRVSALEALTADSLELRERPEAVLVRFGTDADSAQQTCLEIRRAFPEMPVIVISPRIELNTRIRLLDAGADDYLEEPFAEQELIARIRSIIRGRQSFAKQST